MSGYPPVADPAGAFANEDRSWRWARRAVWAWLVAEFAEVSIMLVVFRRLFSEMRKVIDAAQANPNGKPPQFLFSSGLGSGFLLTDLLNLVMLGLAIAFLVWQHGAATTARDLGYPARHSPALGVASWFIPIVSLWFPYQTMRDCLPPNHPAGPSALHAWLAYVGGGLMFAVTMITALFAGIFAIVPLAVTIGLYALAAVLGTRLIKVINDDHRLALQRGGQPFDSTRGTFVPPS